MVKVVTGVEVMKGRKKDSSEEHIRVPREGIWIITPMTWLTGREASGGQEEEHRHSAWAPAAAALRHKHKLIWLINIRNVRKCLSLFGYPDTEVCVYKIHQHIHTGEKLKCCDQNVDLPPGRTTPQWFRSCEKTSKLVKKWICVRIKILSVSRLFVFFACFKGLKR